MSFKEFLIEFEEKRFHDFFRDLRREKKFGAVYFGKHGWFDLYLILETRKEFADFHSSPGKITEAWPEGIFMEVADACVRISNLAQKSGMRKQKGTIIIQYPEENEGGSAYMSYRITVLSKLVLRKGNRNIFDIITHEWAHTVLFNLPMHVKKEFNKFVDWHRNRLSNSYRIPLKNIPTTLEEFDNRPYDVKKAMEEYVMYNELPYEYCLLNGDEMWAICVETLISGEFLNPTLRKMVINSL